MVVAELFFLASALKQTRCAKFSTLKLSRLQSWILFIMNNLKKRCSCEGKNNLAS